MAILCGGTIRYTAASTAEALALWLFTVVTFNWLALFATLPSTRGVEPAQGPLPVPLSDKNRLHEAAYISALPSTQATPGADNQRGSR